MALRKEKLYQTQPFLPSLVVIHTHRRQPHHALICGYIYTMYAIYLYNFVYTKIIYCIARDLLIDLYYISYICLI